MQCRKSRADDRTDFMNSALILTFQFAAQEAFGITLGSFFGARGEWSSERKHVARFLRGCQRRPRSSDDLERFYFAPNTSSIFRLILSRHPNCCKQALTLIDPLSGNKQHRMPLTTSSFGNRRCRTRLEWSRTRRCSCRRPSCSSKGNFHLP